LIHLPEDLSPPEFRRHPVTSTLRDAASGGVPTEAELDALKLPAAVRRQVGDAAAKAAAMRLAGQNADARDYANERATLIVDGLAPEFQDPDYRRPPEPDTYDPGELAESVGRW
jgi:hypothetical protein